MISDIPQHRPFDAYQSFVLGCKLYWTRQMFPHLRRQADAVVAAELGVAIGTALLDVRRQVFDSQDKPVQWLHGLYRPDRYEYQLEVSQVGSIDARISVKDALQP